jgi:hypothetical protein
MKKLIIASFILVSSFIFSKANAQAYVGIKMGWVAPPILVPPPLAISYGPRAIYSGPAPYYRNALPVWPPRRTYYPEYYRERCWRHHRRW